MSDIQAHEVTLTASAREHVKGRTVAAAARDLRTVAQHDDEVAVEHRLQLADPGRVDDRRPRDADEAGGIEPRLETGHCRSIGLST
jgi:hypothetical protein